MAWKEKTKQPALSSPAGCRGKLPPARPSPIGECQNGARAQGFATPRQKTARPCALRAVQAKRQTGDGRLRRDATPYRAVEQVSPAALCGKVLPMCPD